VSRTAGGFPSAGAATGEELGAGSTEETYRRAVPATERPVDADRALVDAVLQGDADAFRELVDREGASVVRACSRILGDRSEAEDLAQEAFVIAYRSLPAWRGDGRLGAWVTRIAVRLALRQASRRQRVGWFAIDAAETGGPMMVISADPAPADPVVHALRVERDTELRRVVGALGEPYREVVALRFFADLSLAEIAMVTERPLGTVKTHLHRGLARLRELVAEDRP
jgi:RNA polymerase sigma-70 factor, ECF subfamily